MALGPLRAVRPLLVRRIGEHADPLCTSLLAVLDMVEALHDRLDTTGRALVVAVAVSLADAARRVTFDDTSRDGPVATLESAAVPTRPEPPTLPALVPARRALVSAPGDTAALAVSLVDAVESLQADLLFAADTQDYVDARLNAACYLRAAGSVQACAEPLAALGRRIAGSAD